MKIMVRGVLGALEGVLGVLEREGVRGEFRGGFFSGKDLIGGTSAGIPQYRQPSLQPAGLEIMCTFAAHPL